jgi:tetratricopeptide (TPR) repeat protein
MPEFQTWRKCSIESKERILWIRGTLGVGKTIMAGYFIELLKCLYPNAVVAYFFCRRDQAGLTRVRDIIRTLAYQSALHNNLARSALDSLRCKDLPIDDNVGIGFLFDKLLRDPLNRSDELFIVLDGLDEADRVSLDSTERPPKTEMDILLQHLTTLPARLLFVSRGEADISRVIPNLITKSLGKGDNSTDIDAYIRQAIDASERLKTHFQNEKIDAFQYFHDKANGIFLWVVIVLHQLAQAKSTSMFRKFLNGFSEASDMKQLYSSVLSRIEGEDRRWMQEILKWVLEVRQGPWGSLSVDELKEAVEWSLQDSLPEFETFLEVEGGSLFHLVPRPGGGATIELIHETLKSFLKNPIDCPQPFYVDHEIASLQVFEVCLDVLSTKSDPTSLSGFAARNWVWYIPADNMERSHLHLTGLRSIYRFFNSGGCIRWMRQNDRTSIHLIDLVKMPYLGMHYLYGGEQFAIQNVYLYLQRLQWLDCESEVDLRAFRWLQDVLKYPSHLGEYIGRAAAERWVCDDLPLYDASRVFSLALSKYCEKEYPEIDELSDLRAKGFQPLLAWCGCGNRTLKSKNLGIALLILRNWKEATECLERERESNDIDTTSCIGRAYMQLGDYDSAIRTFQIQYDLYVRPHSTGLNTGPTRFAAGWTSAPWPTVPPPPLPFLNTGQFTITLCLALAYKAKGDIPRAAEVLEIAVNQIPRQRIFLELVDCHLSMGNYFKILGFCVQAPEKFRCQWWLLQCLVETGTQLDRIMKTRQWMKTGSRQEVPSSMLSISPFSWENTDRWNPWIAPGKSSHS